MQIKDLDVGEMLQFGCMKCNTRNGVTDLLWRKVSDDNYFILMSRFRQRVDDAEYSRANNDRRRTAGCNFWPKTNMHQWLNSTKDEGWFTPVDEHDGCGALSLSPGFLSDFSDAELNALEEFEITCKVPKGYVLQNGKTVTLKCKVTLPSISNVREGWEDKTEGDVFDGLRVFDGYDTVTRTPNGGVGLQTSPGGSVSPSEPVGIRPLIKINGECEIFEAGLYGGGSQNKYVICQEGCVSEDELTALICA